MIRTQPAHLLDPQSMQENPAGKLKSPCARFKPEPKKDAFSASAPLLERAPAPPSADPNTRGWESVARKWAGVWWPRRPKWENEFDNAAHLFAKAYKSEALVLGATPEFRAWLHNYGANVSVYEKSWPSYAAMSLIMETQLHVKPAAENILRDDWEGKSFEKGRYALAMGDIVSGYLQTQERFASFLSKIHSMLANGGVFLLREFPFEPFTGDATKISNVDLRRWAYILTPGFAIEGSTFHEAKLAHNLARIGDLQAFATCANPPRDRLMLNYGEFDSAFKEAGFDAHPLVAPSFDAGLKPALWALRKD